MPKRSTVYTISPSPDSTLALETSTSGLMKRKHLFVFERFRGTLIYDADHPLDSALHLTVEADSLVCRDDGEKASKRARVTQAGLRRALGSETHPELELHSERFSAKPLRGFIVEGKLRFRGIDRNVRANIGFGTEKKNRLQIDADATLRLSDFNVPRLSSLFGLVRTNDEVMLHALIWGQNEGLRP